MWKYLAFNTFWFIFLFFSPFSKNRGWHFAAIASIVGVGIYSLLNLGVDPFAWLFYVVFSLLVFWTAAKFHAWAKTRLKVLDEEMSVVTKALEKEKGLFRKRAEATEKINERASEMEHLFDKAKELSKSLDVAAAFLIFAEATAGHFRFRSMRLTLFDEETGSQTPEDKYELSYSDFENVFDRSIYLKDTAKLKSAVTPFDKKIDETVFAGGAKLKVLENTQDPDYAVFSLWPEFTPFLAYPIFIQNRLFGILAIFDVIEKDLPMLSILAERFISEAQRVRLYQRIQTLAITDGLTGTYVRRHLLERLAGEIDRCERFDFKLSFLMIDIDHFKQFNDQYGHLTGDVVLKQIAETIKKSVRELDLVGRYGGEEFGVLLVETDESGAFYVAERIRKAVAEKECLAYDEKLSVTVSIGCATLSPALKDMNALIDAADSALYEAKKQGRNRVAFADSAL